jgi:hypothetical protein
MMFLNCYVIRYNIVMWYVAILLCDTLQYCYWIKCSLNYCCWLSYDYIITFRLHIWLQYKVFHYITVPPYYTGSLHCMIYDNMHYITAYSTTINTFCIETVCLTAESATIIWSATSPQHCQHYNFCQLFLNGILLCFSS